MKTVRIYGMAPNLGATPPPAEGDEVWISNWHRGYKQRLPRALEEWTRYFNFHSRKHMDETYPSGVEWYQKQDGTRPIYTQKFQPDFPGCVVFPRTEIEAFFPEARPNGLFYTTCTVCWQIAFAIMLGFERIELWGFALSDLKPREAYKFERPCFFYWVENARRRGIEVFYQAEVEALPYEPGDPSLFKGPVYGFETKPEE